MTEKILLPVDLAQAEVWKKVIEEAIGMAQRRQAELHVLWVVPSLSATSSGCRRTRSPSSTPS